MILKKRLKAGVLIYALLMAAIFILLLQFYLDRVVANQRQNKALEQNSQSYLIAQLVKEQANGSSGTISFEEGKATYQREGERLSVKVTLTAGASYSYDFVNGETPNSSSSSKDKSKDKSRPYPSSDTSKDKSHPSSTGESSSSQSDDES